MKLLTLFSTLLILTACGNQNGAIELQFSEQEAGVEPYKTRMIITDDFLRIDDGPDNKDFILLDRKARKISSISYDNQRIFEIPFREVTLEKPTDLVWEYKAINATDAPTIDGIVPTGHSFSANQQDLLTNYGCSRLT